LNESSKNGGVLFVVMLIVFVAVLISALLRSGDPDVKQLDSQEFQQAVEERAFAVHPEEDQPTANDADQAAAGARGFERGIREEDSVNDGAQVRPGPLLVKDEDQTVTGLLKQGA
jgi:hypothetical protein